MKVIFLDFDGVINNWHTFHGVDKNNVDILKKIIEKTNAKVIATTSNKYSFQANKNINMLDTSFFYHCEKLREFGIEIYDVTPFVNRDRNLEIKEYLKNHIEVEQYVILDDDLTGDDLIEHQVYLDLYKGLQEEHIKPTIDILNGKLGFFPKDYDRRETLEKRLIRINKYYNNC